MQKIIRSVLIEFVYCTHAVLDRFSRPSFSARSRTTPTTVAASSTAFIDDEEIVKQKAKPVAAPATRGRSRYFFYIFLCVAYFTKFVAYFTLKLMGNNINLYIFSTQSFQSSIDDCLIDIGREKSRRKCNRYISTSDINATSIACTANI